MSEELDSRQVAPRVAHLLAQIGALMELNGRDPFRARAFTRAARALNGVDVDLAELARSGRLSTLPGVGARIASVIDEYLRTGRSALHDELSAATPPGLHDLLRVPGLGLKRIHALHAELGIEGLDDLEAAARAGRIAPLPGFGPKTEARILDGIGFARSSRQLRRYPEALEVATRLGDWLLKLPGVVDVQIVGALRRRMEVVSEIALVASTTEPRTAIAAFRSLDARDAAVTAGSTETINLADGFLVHLRCVEPEAFGTAVLWDTGSSAHLDQLRLRAGRVGGTLDPRGLTINGVRQDLATEADVYSALGLAFVPPELREGDEEPRAAELGPYTLVTLDDLRGTFHCHTTYSDGKATLVEMADAARERGWSYLGIADHSRSAAYASGLTIDRVRIQHKEINSLNSLFAALDPPFRIFAGIESDILRGGGLDYPTEVLECFDYVVGSVHGSLAMSEEQMTQRIVSAVLNPALTILGHPTGRLLLIREEYPVDMEAVLLAAASAGIVIEINADPRRLDLDWRHVRKASELGIVIAINPDAHSVAALDNVAYGVDMARKAGIEPRQVLNTWPTQDVVRFFAERKRKRAS